MAQLILFGGGDAGGLFIGPKGVRPIPPFDPNIRLQLRGLSALLNGSEPMPKKTAREMATLINKLSNLIFAQVEGIIGPLEGDTSLIYQDEEGGFYCGSTGKPPVHFSWPPQRVPSLNDLIAAGMIERELVTLLRKAGDQKMDICAVLEDPATAAKKLDMQVSKKTIMDLQQLAPSRVEKISDPVSREVLQFFHQVAKDGRFLTTWTTRPYEVAELLKVKVSDVALERILSAGGSPNFDPGEGIIPIVIIIVIAFLVFLPKCETEVRDTSGIAKF